MEPDLIDPRTMSAEVYRKLAELRAAHDSDRRRLKDQYNQAVQTYTYLATWGLLRLKAEELAMTKEGWTDIVKIFFSTLQKLSNTPNLSGTGGLVTLSNQNRMSAETYLGLTGLGLKLSREFAFWASAIYADVKAEAEQEQ